MFNLAAVTGLFVLQVDFSVDCEFDEATNKVQIVGSNARIVPRQALAVPTQLPTGWKYLGCYTCVLLYLLLRAIES